MGVVQGPWTLKWGDKVLKEKEPETILIWQGQKIVVDEFEIRQMPDDYQQISINGRVYGDKPDLEPIEDMCRMEQEVTLKIHDTDFTQQILEHITKDGINTMGYLDESACDKACDDGYGASRLEREAVALDKGEDEQLLAKYNVVNDDGTLTTTGKNLLLAVVFKDSEVKGRLLETLRAIDGTKKPKAVE